MIGSYRSLEPKKVPYFLIKTVNLFKLLNNKSARLRQIEIEASNILNSIVIFIT